MPRSSDDAEPSSATIDTGSNTTRSPPALATGGRFSSGDRVHKTHLNKHCLQQSTQPSPLQKVQWCLLCVFVCLLYFVYLSPWAHLHVVGMLQIMPDINQPSLPTPFYSVLVSISVSMAFSTVFHSITFPDNSPFSDSVLLVLSLP